MTGFNGMSREGFVVMGMADETILALWRAGFDTLDIARNLRWPENEIANRLIHVREAQRRDQEWNFDRPQEVPRATVTWTNGS